MNKSSAVYIGITGFKRRDEVEKMVNHFAGLGLNGEHKLMVGVLVSSSWLKNEQYGYPRIGELHQLFVKHEKVFNTIHFRSREQGSFFSDLHKLLMRVPCGSYDGIQINTAWPSPNSIKEIKRQCFKGGHYFITLEVGPDAFRVINSPNQLVKKLTEYNDVIDYVLLDGSAGNGVNLDPELMKKYISVIKRDNNLNFGVGVAGGLDGYNLKKLDGLLLKYPCTSIDAEKRLQSADGSLDLDACRYYLDGAAALYKQRNPHN